MPKFLGLILGHSFSLSADDTKLPGTCPQTSMAAFEDGSSDRLSQVGGQLSTLV